VYKRQEYLSDGSLADSFSPFIESATPDRCITPTIVVYEVYKRIASVYNDEEALKAVAHIKICTSVSDMTESIAISAADLSLKHRIPMADSIILATANSRGATTITSDSDFKELENVIFFSRSEIDENR
jgi:predicted nucleic acid-binding protein